MRTPALAPFNVRSFRFQWPADLAASWSFEMETLILGWYVLAATGSVELLVAFSALQWVGALGSPLFGVAGDRIGYRTLLYVTRAIYAVLAGTLMTLTLTGALVPWHVFTIAAVGGLIRPSDMVMRHALIGQTVPSAQLLGAFGISRTTADSARIAGAMALAFLVNLLAFPFVLGLLPYVAKDVYAVGQTGLGYLAAAGTRRSPMRRTSSISSIPSSISIRRSAFCSGKG